MISPSRRQEGVQYLPLMARQALMQTGEARGYRLKLML